MGRFIYLILFKITSKIIVIILPFKFNAYIRNSYFKKYFQFLKSDLDISIHFFQPEDFTKNCKKISFCFRLNPLIKEINFYYLPNMQVELQNYYEYLRDPSLAYLHKEKSFYTKEECFVFLLRMYLSNYKNMINLNQRTISKFEHYFSLCNIQLSSSSADGILNQLISILETPLAPVIKSEIEYFLKCLDSNIKLEEVLKKSEKPDILIAIFPHSFYFLNLDLDLVFNELRPVTLLQLSWDLWGLSTQPQQHQENLSYLKKFKNLQLMVHKLNYNDESYARLKKQVILDSQNILEKLF